MNKMPPLHLTQAFGLNIPEKELDFFDLNLEYDSRLFIDPFLIRKSSVLGERELFKRFGNYFRFAYDKSLLIETDAREYDSLKTLLNIHEPREIGLGYTENSHEGSGPGKKFAKLLLEFFIHSSARRLVKEADLYPDGQFNPVLFDIFIDNLGPDGISDISANIVMDYLVRYTQEQCNKLGIPLRELPLNIDGFDFDEMDWKRGGYYNLPENPLKAGQAVILVPKRFLRASDAGDEIQKSLVKDILRQDPELTRRFSDFLEKQIADISVKEIRRIFLEEESVFKKYLKLISDKPREHYDFENDFLKILSIKTYNNYFDGIEITTTVKSCNDFLERVKNLIKIYTDHFSSRDGWRDMWATPSRPQVEAVMGRVFRAMGFAYFEKFKSVTFIPEAGTGNGPVDFLIVNGDCRIVIELKRLMNSSPKGNPPLVSYLHGIERQLPEYSHLHGATYAIYITGQHWTARNRKTGNHDSRVAEIASKIADVETRMKQRDANFESLMYVNINLSPHPPVSKI